MKIQLNSEMQEFFERCFENMTNDYINEYIGIVVPPEYEQQLQEELNEIGVLEFQGPKENWPSIYLSSKEYKKTPYNSHIRLDNIHSHGFEYATDIMPEHELFNVSFIQNDPNRELNDSLMLRAFDEPYEAAVLLQNGEYWMSDTPQEANTINPYAQKAHGKLVTFGLGIGYYVYMALLNPEVESVTVVEWSEDVIAMFKEHLLPQFPRNDKITIIQGDAFEYYNEEFLSQFDYSFADIWKSNDDGYEMIERMLESYLPDYDKADFWIETTCTNLIASVMCVYFNALSKQSFVNYEDPFMIRLYNKVSTYFDTIDETVEDYHVLQDYMYNQKVIREIIATKVN